MEKIKVKKIVFDDTDIRHAQLRIRLQHDGMSQAEFFRAMITGYIEKDKSIMNYIIKYMKKRGDSKRKTKILEKDLECAKTIGQMKDQMLEILKTKTSHEVLHGSHN